MSDTLEHPFDPIVFSDTKLLFLGSFPSIHSFEKGFYYANPRNQFWQILSRITGYPVNNRDQRIWLLKAQRWGLWDMVRSCSRNNSLDSSLYDEEVNDIPSLLERTPSIAKIAFTGRKAEALYRLHFDHLDIQSLYLPSPSAAYAKMNLETKAVAWRDRLITAGGR